MCWLFVPRLRADGWLRIGGQEHRLEGELAYHDHNWGRFWWGDDFGWTWGTFLSQGPEDPWSLVFLRMTDRRRLRCLSQALYVWHHDEPAAIFRHAAVQTRSHGLLGRAADCTLPPPDAAAARRRGAGRAGAGRDHRDAGGRRGARRVPPAVLRPPGSAERGAPGPVDRALRDQRHRPGERRRSTARASTSSAPAYSSFSMAERVSSLLRRSVEHLADEVPDSYRLLLDELGPMVVELDVDGELFSLRGGHRLEVSDGAADTAGARIATSRAAILDVLDARVGLARGGGGGHRCRARLARRRPACARHSARVRPRRGPGTVAARAAVPHSGRAPSMTDSHPDPGLLQAAPPRSRSSAPASPASPPPTNWRSAASTSRCTSRATDERDGLGGEPAGTYPPVKLGGLAASQYSTVGPVHDGSPAELRPFPGRRGQPRDPGRAVAGEHGFRFFPAYYMHIWDLFQRIPVYQRTELGHGDVRWLPTSRTIMDNVRRVVTQGTTVEGKPSLVFPREAPRSPAEFLTTAEPAHAIGLHRSWTCRPS